MDLTIITPNGKEINVAIEDFAPYEDQVNNEDQIGLILLEDKQAQMLRNTLEYHSLKVEVVRGMLLLLPKPKKFLHNPKQDTLQLIYK